MHVDPCPRSGAHRTTTDPWPLPVSFPPDHDPDDDDLGGDYDEERDDDFDHVSFDDDDDFFPSEEMLVLPLGYEDHLHRPAASRP